MTKFTAILLATAIVRVALNANSAHAFPDTARHGYVSCSTCHVSPSGGGLLNPYGRSLSRELMSTWSYAGEEQPLHGALTIPEKFYQHFAIGGDTRYLNRTFKASTRTTDEGFLMQAQLRAGLLFEKIKFIATIGQIDNPRKSAKVHLLSPEYYVLWSLREDVHVRAGRFEPSYGLRLPDHNLWIKSEIGLVPWNQRDSSEVGLESASQFFTLTGFQSTTKTDPNVQATGYTFSFYQVLAEKTRLGASFLNSEGPSQRSRAMSLHGTIAMSEHFYLLSEATRVWKSGRATDVGFARLGYELFKGFTPFAQWQTRVDRSSTSTKSGGGVIWLPRPHFEIMAQFEELAAPQGHSTEGLLLLHYYL